MTVPLSAFGLPSPVPLWEAVFLTLLSYGVGVLGGIVGLALGTMRLPFLLLLGMPAPVAAGTNILVSTLSAATGSSDGRGTALPGNHWALLRPLGRSAGSPPKRWWASPSASWAGPWG